MMDSETRTLGDELDRLDAKADDLVGEMTDAEGTALDLLRSQANDVEQAGAAVAHLIDKHGRDATVTVEPLTAGLQARLMDRVARKREELGQSSTPGYRRNVMAGGGTTDAPFFDTDADLDDRIASVAAQPPGVAVWLNNVVNDISTLSESEGNWQPLSERLTDK